MQYSRRTRFSGQSLPAVFRRCVARGMAIALCLAGLTQTLTAETSGALLTQEDISDYLSARSHWRSYEFGKAAENYLRLVEDRPHDTHLLHEALSAFISTGDRPNAFLAATRLGEAGYDSFLVHNVRFVQELVNEVYSEAADRLLESGSIVGPATKPVMLGWAQIADGKIEDAFQTFSEVPESASGQLIRFHEGLAHALGGDFEASEEVFSSIASGDSVPRAFPDQLTAAWAQSLVQLERRDDAIKVIDSNQFNISKAWQKNLSTLRAEIEAGRPVDFDVVTDSLDGIALFYSIVAREFYLDVERGRRLQAAIFFARLAEMLNPDSAALAFDLATYLHALGSHDLALVSLEGIADSDPIHSIASVFAAEMLRSLDRDSEAGEILTQLAEAFAEDISVHMALGEHWLSGRNYADASVSFDNAVSLTVKRAPAKLGDTASKEYFSRNWRPFYARGIARYQDGDWEGSKADLEFAADNSSGNPYVLNYLGYSMLIQDDDAVEAEALIRKALERDPENAAFIDSLGWALFLQGRYIEALPQLERAVRLMPNVAEIIDHLGDVYWKVGRERDAEFQWKRALLFEDENVDFQRVERKLSIGLDKVLEEEASGLSGN